MSDIIISYREDHHLGLQLYEFFCDRFGTDTVRYGVGSIDGNRTDFWTIVRDADGLVMLITPDWLTGVQNPGNPNRAAAEIALEHDVPVIPVLLDGVAMPSAKELPESLMALADEIPYVLSDANFREEAADLANRVAVGITERRVYGRKPKRKPQAEEAEPMSVSTSSNNPLFVDALFYPYNADREWFNKIGIAALVSFIPFVGGVFVIGYGIRAARMVGSGLPRWDDFGGDFMRGIIVFLGSLFQGMVIYVPALILMFLALEIGSETRYSELERDFVTEPSFFGQQISLLILLFASYVFFLINAIGMANYVRSDQFASFTRLAPLLRETFSQFGRNIAFVVNVFIYGFIILLLTLIGLNFFFFPGLFISAAGTIGYYYLIWRLSQQVAKSDETPL